MTTITTRRCLVFALDSAPPARLALGPIEFVGCAEIGLYLRNVRDLRLSSEVRNSIAETLFLTLFVAIFQIYPLLYPDL